MFSKKSLSVVFVCSLIVFGLILISATIPVGSSALPQTVAAADVSHDFRLAGQNTDHIIFQSEPTLEIPQTDEPAPVVITQVVAATDVPVITPDPNDPAQNPAAPGGVLTNLLNSVVSFATGSLITFIGMLKVFTMLKDNKAAENTIEQLINAVQNSFPATPLKNTINQVGTGLQDAGQVLRDVTDGKPD